jgi:putative membrane protein
MSLRWLLAFLHLLGLGIGLGAERARARALRGPLDATGVRQVLSADAWWGIAALVWISTGLLRAFAGFEKGTTFYLQNRLFLAKIGLLIIILVLEAGPIVEFSRWRAAVRRGFTPDTSRAGRIAGTSIIQAVLVILMVLAATGIARGRTPAARRRRTSPASALLRTSCKC